MLINCIEKKLMYCMYYISYGGYKWNNLHYIQDFIKHDKYMLYFVYILLWTNELYCSQEQDIYVHNLQCACVYLHVYVLQCSLLSIWLVQSLANTIYSICMLNNMHIHILNRTNLSRCVLSKLDCTYSLLHPPYTVMSHRMHV